jgi:hypothetical protein
MTAIGNPKRETTKQPDFIPVPHPQRSAPSPIPDHLPDEISSPTPAPVAPAAPEREKVPA